MSPSWAILANSIQNCNDTENRINIFQRCHSLICSSPSPLSTKGTPNAHKSTHPTQLRRGSLVIIHRFMWSKPSTGVAFMTLLTVSLTVEDEKNYLAMNIKIKNNFWLKHIKAQKPLWPGTWRPLQEIGISLRIYLAKSGRVWHFHSILVKNHLLWSHFRG